MPDVTSVASSEGRIELPSDHVVEGKGSWTLLAVLVYVLAAVGFTWPLVLHPRAVLGALDLPSDPALNLWALGWDLQTLSAHPGWLLNGRIFDANIYLPASRTLAYSDHLLLQALVLWPVYALTHDLVLCYNLLLLGSLVGAAVAMHLLVRALTGSERAAYVGGLIFGFAPYHFTHLPHIQLQALYLLPLTFLLLHRVFAANRRTDVFLLGLVAGLQVVASVYYGVIGVIGLSVAALVLAAFARRLTDWRLVRRGLIAGLVAFLVAVVPSIPYLRVQTEAAAGRNLYEASHGSAVLAGYLQAPETNLLYGQTGWLRPTAGAVLPRREGPEQDLFPGFCAALLALFGLVAAVPQQRATALAYGAVAVAGVVLSLGPEGVRPIYAALHQTLFGMAAIRAPARFSVLTLCGLAVLAASAIPALDRFSRARAPIFAAIVVTIVFEYANLTPFPSAPALTTEAGQWLRDQPGRGAVVCVPMGVFTGNTACMLQSLEHGRRIVNGYSGVRPPFFEALVDVVSRVPAPESLLALHDLGVEYVVSDAPLAVDPDVKGVLVERAVFADQRVYQILWSPEVESLIGSRLDAPPPEPGPPPFAAGELATYRVLWKSGPMRLPAGEATIGVGAPASEAPFRFLVSARTAPWVARFYEADATLESTASARLLPQTYREAILDGKRRIERLLTFDGSRREVRIASGGATIALPLGPEARDPLTALFYIRTLPLAEGSRFTVPLNDAGRRLRLDVAVDRVESLDLDGTRWSAWKLEPRIGDRIDRPDRWALTAWVSADPRRIPLVVEVGAPFGAVRVELANYRER